MTDCRIKCPHCNMTMHISDIFRGDEKFKYKKCGCCGMHVTRKQIFSNFYEGIYHKSNKMTWERVKEEKKTAHQKWEDKLARGEVVGLEGDWSVGTCSLIRFQE